VRDQEVIKGTLRNCFIGFGAYKSTATPQWGLFDISLRPHLEVRTVVVYSKYFAVLWPLSLAVGGVRDFFFIRL